jgi:hypothetical protein
MYVPKASVIGSSKTTCGAPHGRTLESKVRSHLIDVKIPSSFVTGGYQHGFDR